jgi:nitric oxide reductase subunit C
MAADSRKIVVATLLVVAFLSYSCFIYYRLPVKNYAVNPDAAAGKMVWQQYNCNACHQIYGLGVI